MGYFWGLLERKRVCCLLKGNVEKPSDIEGIVYIPFKDSVNDVKEMIVKEPTVAGYNVSSRKEEDNDMIN
jgi:predicted nucleotide-binding protein